MSIADFFFGRKQNKTASRRSAKLNRNAVRTRILSMEPLETRDLLSVTTGLIDDSAYAALREQYPDFNLPADQATLNVMTVDLDEGATALNLADLKSAISTAGTTEQPDLILVKTTDSANTIIYSSSVHGIGINVDASQYGSVTIIGWGTKNLTLNANNISNVMTITGKTDAYLGNITFTKGKTGSDAIAASGGGIYSSSTGILTLTNCTISNNSVNISYTFRSAINNANANGGGIYSSSNNALILTNCTIVNNSVSYTATASSSSSGISFQSHAYGGGIYYDKYHGNLTLTDCTISSNSAYSTTKSSSSTNSGVAYSFGGGIYSPSGILTLTNCVISDNTTSSSGYSYGGGIYYGNNSGTLTLIDSSILNNSASSVSKASAGGGIYSYSSEPLNITGSEVLNNTVSISSTSSSQNTAKGNAIYMKTRSSAITIKDSTISSSRNRSILTSGNVLIENSSLNNTTISTTQSEGTGTSSSGKNISIINSSIVGGSYGVEIDYTYGNSLKLTIYNSIISDCQYGIYTAASYTNATIVNSTITKNSVRDIDIRDSYAVFNIYNTIVALNNNLYKVSGVKINAYNTLSSYSDWSNKDSATNYIYSSSQDLYDSDFKLCANSQAINKGNNSYAVDSSGQPLTVDLAGIPRILDSTVDLGAYEYDSRSILSVPDFTVQSQVSSILVTISEVENSSGFIIEYSVNPDFINSVIISAQVGDNIIENLQELQTYYIRIKSVGNILEYSDSDYSDVKSAFITALLPDLMLSTFSPQVGSVINAYFSSSDATATYQWYCGETIIEGATESSFVVTENQIGQTITCVATGTDDYTGIVRATTLVVPPIILNTPNAPILTTEETTITTSWLAVDNATSYTVKYRSEGMEGWSVISDIQGTSMSFIGTTGTSYNVRVKAVGTGNYTDSDYSETSNIYIPIPLNDMTLSTDTPIVGTVLSTLLFPTEATATYQWYCGTNIIDGATNSSFTVTTDQIGHSVTCTATGIDKYNGTVSATTNIVPKVVLETPVISSNKTKDSLVITTWSKVGNAEKYALEYKHSDSEIWTTISGLQNETATFIGNYGSTYHIRVKAIGTGNYSDSAFSEPTPVYIPIPLSGLTLSTNSPEVGTIITTTLAPSDATVDYQWYCGTTIIDGVTDSSFTVTTDQIGQTITCVATANGAYTGTVSATTAVVPALPLDTPNVPSLTLDGTTITASWSAVDNASTYTVEYQATGSDSWTTIPNITGTTTSFVGLTGTTYNVKVKANGTGDYSDSEFSESTPVYIPIPLGGLTLSTNAPEVGTTITTTLAPSDATVDYQWYCGTAIIDGAEESSFTVTEEQIGQTITCIATGTGAYTGTVSATTAVVPALPLGTPDAPSLTLDGTTVTATWSAVENASTYTVEYLAIGSDAWTTIPNISGTTTFFVGLTGTTYNVRVKSNGTGNYSDSAFSESTSVYIPISLSGLTLSTDTPEVGTTISTTLAPSGATADYQWYCGTTIINGAINSSFTVTEDQIGQTITCIATGTGYYTGTVSATTAVVPALPLNTPNVPTLTLDGTTITVSWSVVDNASTYTVEYQATGSDAWTTIPNISGTQTSFAGLTGTTYNVKVKANGTGNYSDSAFSESASVYILIPLGGLTLSTDTPEVGTTITTTLSPSDATVDYQWYCGTAIIDGAEESSFTVTEEQIGQTITCIATGTGNYTGTVSATTAVVPALPLGTPNAPALTLDGTTITASWSAVDNASTYTVEYQATGSDAWTTIPNILETTTSFAGLTGTTYIVRVKANGTGNYSDSAFSESASVYIPIPLGGLTLSTDTPEVGTTITTTLATSDATVDYQWYCGTTIIDGAEDSSFTVTEEQIGQTITCIATGTGAYTGTVSATTAVVPALPLDTPDVPSLTLDGTTVTATWSAVENASTYTVEYLAIGSDAWTTIPNISGTQTSFAGLTGTTYNVKVKANGTGNYSDSEFSESTPVYIPIPLSGLTLSTNAPEVGTTITTTLSPSDATVDYQWYSGETSITGATESSFTVTEAQIGQTITCVVAANGAYTGTVSATTAVIPALPLDTPNAPTLTVEDSIVTATWSADENASTYTLQYQANGVDGWFVITGINGTSASFAGIAGKTYNVKVKAVGTGNYSESEFSESETVYIPIPLGGLTLSTDTPEVGTVITTTLAPSDATVDYQWYCGETAITGATDSSFTVTTDQIGQTITCIATGTGAYTGTVSATTAVVPAFELDSPVLSALNTVGSIVVAAWSDVDNADGYTLEYKPEDSQKWTSISGLGNTTAAFVGAAGTTYNVRVKANGTGTYSDSSYSATESITLSVPLTGLTLSTTAPEVGTVITTTLAPSDATAEYQWYSGETEIDGATESSFTVTEDQIGQTITCVATGAEGYIGTVSATTAVVPALALDVPGVPELTLDGTTVNAAWSAVENASGYTLEYQPAGAESWSVITGINGVAASFNGVAGATYNVRVKANGTGYYTDSEYSEFASIYIPIPLTGLTLSTTTPEVGTIITTTLTPSDATVDYQWYSGETIIEGAETSSFTVTEDYIGQTITCVATANGAYTGSVSATTAGVPVPVIVLDAPADIALSVYNATVTASWSAVDNASSYTLEYKPIDSENWTALPGLLDTTASFDGVPGTMYNVRVKANGTDGYSDSSYSEINTDKPTGPVVAINLNKVTVSWVDDSPAADAVRYRIAGTTKWTVKKLKAGVTSLTFNASIGVNYDIEVLLDQQETNILQGSAIVLDQPKLKADKAFLKDDTFHVEVTNYAAKNLAANVKQAIVSVNGVMTTLNISNQQGECDLVNGGKVAFDNGRFTFSEMTSNTSYKVQISFSDGHSVSKTSSALTVKTTKTCYLAPVITSATAVSDTSITVAWETTVGKGTETPAQKYTVQYSLDGVKWTNATTAATGNSYTIQKLKGGAVYQVHVLASKDNAFEASAPSDVLTAETLMAPKTAIEKNSITDDSFQLNVTNYQNTNLVKATSITVKSDQFGETVINLENGAGSAAFDNGMTVAFNNGALTFANAPSNTQQKIQVNFSDGVCTTAWSAALTVKTAIASYNQPVLTSATAVSSTSVQVEWSSAVGKNSNTPAQSYTVQYTTDGTRWINANTKVVGTNFTITGLKTGTTYLVAVIANKDSRFNASLPSESRQVTTL